MNNSSLTAAYRTMQLSDTISGCHKSKKSNFTDISKLTHGGYVLYISLLDKGLYYLGQKWPILQFTYVEGSLIHI